MYSNFEFVLEWEDLPLELREEKITNIIEKREDWNYGDEELNNLSKEEQVDNQLIRETVNEWIEMHFPVYF